MKNENLQKNIVWISSYPKSGNTWLRIFLSNLFSKMDDPVNFNELNSTPIVSSRKLFDMYAGVNSSDLTIEEINLIRPNVFEEISQESHTTCYFKVHDAWELNSKKEPIFPPVVTKGAIYIIRNPYDVAVSLANHKSISLEEAINILCSSRFKLSPSKSKANSQISQNLLSWSEHAISWINTSKLPIHVVRYEDMLHDSFNTFKTIVGFLELDYEDKKISTAISNSSFEMMKQQESLDFFSEKPIKVKSFFKSGKSSDLKKLKNDSNFIKLTKYHRTIMTRYGYLRV